MTVSYLLISQSADPSVCPSVCFRQHGLDQWSDALIRRFLHRIGITQPSTVDMLVQTLSPPSVYVHITARHLEDMGLEYWDGARVLAALRVASERRECVSRPMRLTTTPPPTDAEDRGERGERAQETGPYDGLYDVSRVMEWDAETLGGYLETKGLGGTAAMVRRAGIVGYVIVGLDGPGLREEVVQRVTDSPAERIRLIQLLSTGERLAVGCRLWAVGCGLHPSVLIASLITP